VARAAVHAAACLADAPDVLAAEATAAGTTPFAWQQRAVAGAKLLADEAAITNARAAIQVHGGMGYTWEVPLHLHLKRSRVLATTFGTSSYLSALLGSRLPAPAA
jgi:alkylation response protein AidB-like acyl-CoA dehydrogenase